MVAFPSLHVMLGVVNKLCDELEKVWPQFSTWPDSLHLCREQYFSKTFEVQKDKSFTDNMHYGRTLHYGLEKPASRTLTLTLFHELGSQQASARAKRAIRSEQTSGRCDRTSERASMWPSTYVPTQGCSKPPHNG